MNYDELSNIIIQKLNTFSLSGIFIESDTKYTKQYQNENYQFFRFSDDSNVVIYYVKEETEISNLIRECAEISIRNDLCILCFHVELLGHCNIFINQLKHEKLQDLPICIITYDNQFHIDLIQKFRIIPDKLENRSSSELKSFWCWWRDASHYEIAQLLELSIKYSSKNDSDIYSNYIYPNFYQMMISGQTKQWNGQTRKKNESESSFRAEKQNYRIPMVQLGLIDTNGIITEKGKNLLRIYKNYDIDTYLGYLAKLILIDGKHLFLIKDLIKFQNIKKNEIPSTSEEFFILFEKYMTEKNFLGTRKPSAVTTGAKKSYIRDEPKLWNKLGLFKLETSSRYYIPYKGIDFDFDKLVNLILIQL